MLPSFGSGAHRSAQKYKAHALRQDCRLNNTYFVSERCCTWAQCQVTDHVDVSPSQRPWKGQINIAQVMLFRSRTPGLSPFSATKITPASSAAACCKECHDLGHAENQVCAQKCAKIRKQRFLVRARRFLQRFDLFDDFGERAGIRTLDLLIKSQLLYRLSYALPQNRGVACPAEVGGHMHSGLVLVNPKKRTKLQIR
jgi:hypothetical protein